jgi:hypothetical protein
MTADASLSIHQHTNMRVPGRKEEDTNHGKSATYRLVKEMEQMRHGDCPWVLHCVTNRTRYWEKNLVDDTTRADTRGKKSHIHVNTRVCGQSASVTAN